MGAMAVASSVVVMSLGRMDKYDTSMVYKKVKITDSMDYATALKTRKEIITDIKDMKRNIDISNIRISNGAYDKGKYDDTGRHTQYRLKQSTSVNKSSLNLLNIRLDKLEKIIEKKEKKMYPTSYVSRRPSSSGIEF